MNTHRKTHWETIYETKTPEQVSWTQEVPQTSLRFIHALGVQKDAHIIDVGGGDSKLIDYLLHEGYENITVLDISAKALERAKKRLGDKAEHVNWVVCDVTAYQPDRTFDVWHDRAAFHFLTTADEIATYVNLVSTFVRGYLVIGTFSDEGPKKCSGLDIQQYTKQSLNHVFENQFELIDFSTEDHQTPFDTTQNFLFCSFRKR